MNSLGSQVAAVSKQSDLFRLSVFVTLTSHVGKFLASTLEIIAVSGLNGVLDGARHGIIKTQHRALDQLDLPGGITTQTAGTTGRGLSLAPGLGGRGLAAGVGGGHAAGHAKGSGRVLAAGRVVRVVVSGSTGLCGIRLGQTVPRDRAHGRCGAAVRVFKGTAVEGALVEQAAGSVVFAVLQNYKLVEFNQEERVKYEESDKTRHTLLWPRSCMRWALLSS